MGRGSIKHDQSRKGIVPGASRLDKNRKSLKRKQEREQKVTINPEEVEKNLASEGKLVPFKPGKLIKASERPTYTPPPHQTFRKSRTPKKLSQGQMSAAIRDMLAKKKK
eukprot:TRINITY_DN725_c0_g2_i1.p1 TRINITY_DN725_c0_g2~~TRINITY_DN725_c0_g2_i1.p1  ORF type:complete len:109 (+),score=29.23 TRINITY_DN725_c0_g2_i1:56-382(+)